MTSSPALAAPRAGGPTDRGSSTVELALLTPVVLLTALLVLAAGRVSTAQHAVDHAAAVAARDATLARTPGAARQGAAATADRLLGERDLGCTRTRVTVATADFAGAPTAPGTVRVDVVCAIALGDLAVPGLPGTATLASSFTSTVDPYRGRT